MFGSRRKSKKLAEKERAKANALIVQRAKEHAERKAHTVTLLAEVRHMTFTLFFNLCVFCINSPLPNPFPPTYCNYRPIGLTERCAQNHGKGA